MASEPPESTNYSNQTKETELFFLNHPAQYLLIVSWSIIGTIGLIGNILLFVFLAKGISKCKPHELLIFNLNIIDIFMCLNTAILEPYFIYDFQSTGCRISGLFQALFGPLNFSQPPLLMFNRYLSLHNQELYKSLFTKRKTIMYCAATWFLCLLFTFPYLYYNATGLDDLSVCALQLKNSTIKLVHLVAFVYMLCTFAVSVFCGWKCIVRIRNHTSSGSNSQFQSRLIEESGQIIKLISILLICPFISQLPIASAKVIQFFLFLNPWVTRALLCPLPLPAVCSPYLTVLIIKDYKTKLKSMLKLGNNVEILTGASFSRTPPS